MADVAWLKVWLQSLNLPQYLDNFISNGIVTKHDCQALNEDLLVNIGVSLQGHRKRMLNHLPHDSPPESPLYVNNDAENFHEADGDAATGYQNYPPPDDLPVLPTKKKSQKNTFLYEEHKPLKMSTEPQYMNVGDILSPSTDSSPTKSPARPVPKPRRSRLKSGPDGSPSSPAKRKDGPVPVPERPKPAPRASVAIKSPVKLTIADVCETESATEDSERFSDLYAKPHKPLTPPPGSPVRAQGQGRCTAPADPSTSGSAVGKPLTHEPEKALGYVNVKYDLSTDSYTVKEDGREKDRVRETSSGRSAVSKPLTNHSSPVSSPVNAPRTPEKQDASSSPSMEEAFQDDVYEPIWMNSKDKPDNSSQPSHLMEFSPFSKQTMVSKDSSPVTQTLGSPASQVGQQPGSRASAAFELPPPMFPPPPLPHSVLNPEVIADFDPLTSGPTVPPRPPQKPFKMYENLQFSLGPESSTLPQAENEEPDPFASTPFASQAGISEWGNTVTVSSDPFQNVDPFENFEPDYQDFDKSKQQSPFSSPKHEPSDFKFPPKPPPKRSPLAKEVAKTTEEDIYEFAEPEESFDPFGLGAEYSTQTEVIFNRSESSNSSVRLSEVPPAPTWFQPKAEDCGMYSMASTMEDSDESEGDIVDDDMNTNMTPVTMLPPQVLSPRKKERSGYLSKQGGVKQNRGWKKRWIIFDGDNLRYYPSQKSQVSKRVVPLSCMKNVEQDVKLKDLLQAEERKPDKFYHVCIRRNSRRGSDITSNTKQFKFRLVCSNRTFLFAADTLDDCNLWANTLMEAILTYKKPLEGEVPGGVMANPDIEGWIKFDRNRYKYYVALKGHQLCYYSSLEDYKLSSPLHEINMKLSAIKVLDRTKLQLSTNYCQFVLNFESSQETVNWKMAIEEAISDALGDDSVLLKVIENPSNRRCADCDAEVAHWSAANLGIVLCLKCAGIHRGFERRFSCVASLRMETKIWTPSLIEMLKRIGNENANKFWSKNLPADQRINFETSPEERKDFIYKKYKLQRFCDKHPLAADKHVLNEALLEAARTSNIMQTMQILFSGADVMYSRPGTGQVAHDIATSAHQNIQMEFLFRNGGDRSRSLTRGDDDLLAGSLRDRIQNQGYLHKTGSSLKAAEFQKRWCVLEHGRLSYYTSEESRQEKDHIENSIMLCIQATSLDRWPYCFELSTKKNNRVFLFSAETDNDRAKWMCDLIQVFCPVSLIDKVKDKRVTLAGYCYLKLGLGQEWQKTWLLLEGKTLYVTDKEDQELEDESVDLRKVTSIRKITQDVGGSCEACLEQGPQFVINAPDRALYFQADLVKDTDRLFSVLEAAVKVGGEGLEDQALQTDDVPVIIEKCINFIETNGMDLPGIYREAGQNSHVDGLLQQFKTDARSVVLRPDETTIHEVCNALKRFLRNLDDPLLTKNLYDGWIRFAALGDHTRKLNGYKHNVQQLPRTNRITMSRLAVHLHKLSTHADSNKMTLDNIAIAFGATLTSKMGGGGNVGNTVQLEMRVVSEIVLYHEWLFDIEKKQKTKEEEIEQAMKKIRDIQNHTTAAMDSLLIDIFYLDPLGQSQSLAVTKETTASDLVQRLKQRLSLSTSGYCLYEIIAQTIERPLHPETEIWPLILEWSKWSDEFRKSARLVIKSSELIEKIEQSYDPSKTLFGVMNCTVEKKKATKYTFEFTQSKLSYYRDHKKMAEPLESWNIEDILIYKGCDVKRLSSKTEKSNSGNAFTFIVRGEKVGERFGRTVFCTSEHELYYWLAAMYKAQHSTGFS